MSAAFEAMDAAEREANENSSDEDDDDDDDFGYCGIQNVEDDDQIELGEEGSELLYKTVRRFFL